MKRNRKLAPWAPWLPVFALLVAVASPQSAVTQPVLDEIPQVLSGGSIWTESGLVESDVLVRDGLIDRISADLEVPAGAKVWDVSGLVIYPGLIDSWVEVEAPTAEDAAEEEGNPLGSGHPLVTPEFRAIEAALEPSVITGFRNAGFTTLHVLPGSGILRGRSALLSTADQPMRENLLTVDVVQAAAFDRSSQGGYPVSMMGSTALLRQSLASARWYQEAMRRYEQNPRQRRPVHNVSWQALAPVIDAQQALWFDAEDVLETLRAGRLLKENDLQGVLLAPSNAYQYADAVSLLDRPLIVGLAFPEEPDVADAFAHDTSLVELRAWREGPSNPASLVAAGSKIALTANGLGSPAEFAGALQRALNAGLDARQALLALTAVPARLLGMESQIGSVAEGKLANLVVAKGELLTESPDIRSVWVEGRRFARREIEPPEVNPVGSWEVTLDAGGQNITFEMVIAGEQGAYSGSLTAMGNQLEVREVLVSGKTAIVTVDASAFGGGTFELRMKIDGNRASGSGDSPMGAFQFKAKRKSPGAVGAALAAGGERR